MRLEEYTGVLTKIECSTLVYEASANLKPAQTMSEDKIRVADAIRLSKKSEILQKIKNFISKQTKLPIENQEPIQIVRYSKGGFYKPHWDYYFEDDYFYENEVARGGNRTHTVLFYLNHDYRGGETYFNKLGLEFEPELGKALIWENKINGSLIENSQHEGLPVISGEKWIGVVWVRERKYIQ